jgi:undecaprenyl-diphosphatase
LAVLSVFVYYYRKVWPWALGFILLMAFARMHNGMHYPSDVLAGTILGICYGLIAVWLIRKIAK